MNWINKNTIKPIITVMMKAITLWDPYPHISEAITHPAKPRRLAAPVCYSDDADDKNSQ